MLNLFYIVSFIALGFFGIIVPKLIVGISLAVNTIEKSKADIKRKLADKEEKINLKIDDLEKQKLAYEQRNRIKKSRHINKKIINLQKSKEKYRRRAARLIKRYRTLNYRDGILFPSIFMLFSVLYAFLGTKCIDLAAVFTSYSLVFLFLLIVVARVLKCFYIISDAKARENAYEKTRISDAFNKVFFWQDEITKP